MAGKPTPTLLVTANVGSIFEDPSTMLKVWIEEFLSTISRLDPKFIALHCQEVGGKNYERSMKHVEYFVRLLMSSEELRLFDRVRFFLDEDYSSAEHFTALGNFYFIHESVPEVLMWDFSAMAFVTVKGKDVHSGNIEAVTTKEKSKFPQDFFPECKWSRKGFLRTRWNLNGTVFDLINIHLFHDASNFVAMESFPSVYCRNRRRALEHTLERFHNDAFGPVPFFVFGDFNFRIDTQGVVKKLAEGLNPIRLQSNKNADYTKLQYRDSASQVILSLGKKEFSHQDHQTMFTEDNGKWLKEFDKELEPFGGRLFEFSITFPPSYPFEENEKGARRYMQTRCPSWCDRVILSPTAKALVNNASDPKSIEYGLMGLNTCMGDHKPVYLKVDLIANAGTISCCTYHDADCESQPCFGQPVLRSVTCTHTLACWSFNKSLSAHRTDTALTLKINPVYNTQFLAPPQSALSHEPYTPESMDTPSSSPVPLRMERDFKQVVDSQCEEEESFEETEEATCVMCDKLIAVETDAQEKPSILRKSINTQLDHDITVIQQSHLPVINDLLQHSHSQCVSQKEELGKYDKSEENCGSEPLSSTKKFIKKSDSMYLNENSIDVSVPENATSKYQYAEYDVQTCRCFSDRWKRRTVPVVKTSMKNKPRIRVRLISSSSDHSARLQSHHSSSDEDWFEEVESDSLGSNNSDEIFDICDSVDEKAVKIIESVKEENFENVPLKVKLITKDTVPVCLIPCNSFSRYPETAVQHHDARYHDLIDDKVSVSELQEEHIKDHVHHMSSQGGEKKFEKFETDGHCSKRNGREKIKCCYIL